MEQLAEISNLIEDSVPENGEVSVTISRDKKGRLYTRFTVIDKENNSCKNQKTDNLFWALKEIILRLTA